MAKGKRYISLGLMILISSCFPPQRRVSFDKNKFEVSLCEPGTIRDIKVYGRARGNYGQMNKISEIYCFGQWRTKSISNTI
jgi:hypothetical protein